MANGRDIPPHVLQAGNNLVETARATMVENLGLPTNLRMTSTDNVDVQAGRGGGSPSKGNGVV